MEHEQNSGTTGPADEQGAIGADPTRDPATDPTAAPGPDDSAQVTLDPPYPHETQPGYGVTGKFPTDGDDDDAGDVHVSEPASETDALAVEAPAPVTVEQPAAESDQLDVPREQRGDTA